jgi:hypothetical protein
MIFLLQQNTNVISSTKIVLQRKLYNPSEPYNA